MKYLLLLIVVISVSYAQQTGGRYLIITHDAFYPAVQPLAEWKNRTGMKCRIAKLSETGSTADAIRNYIVNAYTTWLIKPEFILLVGAPNFIPLPVVSGTYSDNYYTNMDADIYNEILSGRLTVRDTIQARTVVNKILAYERYPLVSDPTWFKKGTLIVNVDNDPPDDSIYWSDLHYAAGLMVANGFTLVDTLSDIYGHNASTVLYNIYFGRSFLLYRGSGINNWDTPFDCNPNASINDRKLPIVLSITCRTMGTGSTPAAAEYWLLTGTPTILRGAAGYFATTTAITDGAHLRSAVTKGFFDALFIDHKRTFGEACEAGRICVYTLYPGEIHEYYGFTTLGDPEMGLWTDTPCPLAVTHPTLIRQYNADFTIQVNSIPNGTPEAGAFVCVMGRQDTLLYAMDTTDAEGNAHFSVQPQVINDTVFVTVSGQNLQPYEGRMVVWSSIPNIEYLRSFVDDSLSGNNDHKMNPGESIFIPLWVFNIGGDTAFDVYGTLRTNDTFVTIIDSLRSFNTIISLDSACTDSNGFQLTLNSCCQDEHVIDFELECRDINDSSWISHFSKKVAAGSLTYWDALISGGNGNTGFEPGETVTVAVILKDNGHAGLDSIHTILQSLSPYSSVIDSLGFYPHVGPDSFVSNTMDQFTIYCLTSTPVGTAVNLQMIVQADYYHDTISFFLIVGQQDYWIWNPDPTPSSGIEIHDQLTALGYSGSLNDTLPICPENYHSMFACAGIHQFKRIIFKDCPETIIIRDYLENHHGRMYLEGGDVWFYDPRYNNGYCFDTLFGLNAVADGNPDMGPVVGQDETFTNTMEFAYEGENAWMDHIDPGGGFLIFHDGDNMYNCGVAYDPGSYRTVGVSFELGSLVDGVPPSTRSVLLDSIMHFFGIRLIGADEGGAAVLGVSGTLAVYPVPGRGRLTVRIDQARPVVGTLRVYDITGRLRRTIFQDAPVPAGIYECTWDGRDDRKSMVAEGIYFLRWESEGVQKTVKAVYLGTGGAHH